MKECLIEGCARKPHARGWCGLHYQRWKTHGDPQRVISPQRQECSITGCTRPASGKRMCGPHYGNWKRTGEPLRPIIEPGGDLLDSDAAAIILGVSRAAVQMMVRDGRLSPAFPPPPGCRNCRRNFFRRAEVEALRDARVPRNERPCSQCREKKPLSGFRTDKRGKKRSICRECDRAYGEKYYAETIEERRAHARRFYTANKQEISDRTKARRDTNREAALAKERAAHARHRKSEREKAQKRRDAMTEEQRSEARRAHREWLKANPEKVLDLNAQRRARRMGAPEVVKIDRAAIIERDQSTCYLCERELLRHQVVLDHVIPLVRGGPHVPENLRVACRSCNARKHAMSVEEFRERSPR